MLKRLNIYTIDPSEGFRIIDIKSSKALVRNLYRMIIFWIEYTKYQVSMDFLPNISNYEWHDGRWENG